MENEIESEGNHVIKRVFVKPGDTVAADAVLVEFED
ncbi:hypothetical protein [uncultured Muribaculum sp.]